MMVAACTTAAAEDDEGGGADCGNGQVDGSEQCDGTDFGASTCASQGDGTRDFGELSCTSECKVVADACVIGDEDQDQLSIADEEIAGTDPLNPDTDGDGVLDGIEVQNGSDPLNIYSWPQGQGTWPNRLEAAKADPATGMTGWTVGDVLLNQPWTDQFGQEVRLHQFYGYVTVLSVGAVWCPPCNDAAQSSQTLWDQYRDQGVMFVEQLNDGNQQGGAATQADVDGCVQKYSMQFPVVWAGFALFTAPSIPTFYILDRGMVLREIIQGYPGDAAIGQAIAAVVAEGKLGSGLVSSVAVSSLALRSRTARGSRFG
jgi:hypothetical protein